MPKKKSPATAKESPVVIARKALEISGVILRGVKMDMDPELYPEHQQGASFRVQYASTPKRFVVMEAEGNNVSVCYTHEFGIRLIHVPEESEGKKPDSSIKPSLQIECLLDANYKVKESSKEPPNAALTAFGETNVPYNLWPFWRELVLSFTQKAGWGGLTVPLFYAPPNH